MNLKSLKKCPLVYHALLLLRKLGGRAWMRGQFLLRGVDSKRVVFSSFKGKAYSDSPRCISEALHAIRPDVEIVWILADSAEAPGYIRRVKPRTLAALKELATAGCFVDNFNRPLYMKKSPGQLYVQTWHGDRGFKKILYDMNDGKTYPDPMQMDLAISGSEFGTKIYRSAFRYDGEVLEEGMPRNDALVNPEPNRIAQVRRKLGIPAGAKIMLYAPTFRDATSGRAQDAGFDLGQAVESLKKSTGESWICLTRAHDQNKAIAGGENITRDVTSYPEMTDLLLISDLLITDYSSSASDFVLLDRPAILFQPDLDEFTQDDRQMYFDLRSCPHLRAESEAELMRMLGDFDNLPRVGKKVLEFYGANETGHAAEKAAKWISDRLQ